jgi:hypothetical protein
MTMKERLGASLSCSVRQTPCLCMVGVDDITRFTTLAPAEVADFCAG